MNALITQSLKEENITLLLGFPDVLLSKSERKWVTWIKEYTMKYAKPPTVERLEKEFETFISLRSPDPLGDIYDQELVEKRNHYTREYLMGIQDELKKGADPVPLIEKLHSDIRQGGSDVTLYTKYDRSLYLRKPSSYPYDIPQIDKYTGGVGKGDLIYLIGRLGIGKTSFAVWMLMKWLWRDCKILMVSNENRADDVISKVDAFVGGFNPLKKRTMEWDDDDRNRITTVSYIASKMKGEVIIPNKPVKGIDELYGLIYSYQPNLVIVDGIYLMNGASGDSHWEKITGISRSLKRMAEEEGVPIVGIHQASRNAVGKHIEVEHIAYSDALAQDADLLLALNKDEEEDIFCECIKNRWGQSEWGFFLKFFWDSMHVRVRDARTAMEEE